MFRYRPKWRLLLVWFISGDRTRQIVVLSRAEFVSVLLNSTGRTLMFRYATVALTLLISGPALADDSSTWLDDTYSFFDNSELDLIEEALKEFILGSMGYEYDEIMLDVCDDFVTTYEEEKEEEEEDAEKEAAEALEEAAEEAVEEVADYAIDWLDHSHIDEDGNPLRKGFPSGNEDQSGSTDGWICNFDAPACGNYSTDAEVNQTWTVVSDYLPEGSPIRACYQAEGSDLDAQFTVRAESDADCDGTYDVYEQHVHIGEDGDAVRSEIERTTTTEATFAASSTAM